MASCFAQLSGLAEADLYGLCCSYRRLHRVPWNASNRSTGKTFKETVWTHYSIIFTLSSNALSVA